jgi:DNA modification methylase
MFRQTFQSVLLFTKTFALIKLTTKENQIILDPLRCSGTTAVASNNLKRQFIGFEISQEYYEKSFERLEKIPANQNKKTSFQINAAF